MDYTVFTIGIQEKKHCKEVLESKSEMCERYDLKFEFPWPHTESDLRLLGSQCTHCYGLSDVKMTSPDTWCWQVQFQHPGERLTLTARGRVGTSSPHIPTSLQGASLSSATDDKVSDAIIQRTWHHRWWETPGFIQNVTGLDFRTAVTALHQHHDLVRSRPFPIACSLKPLAASPASSQSTRRLYMDLLFLIHLLLIETNRGWYR